MSMPQDEPRKDTSLDDLFPDLTRKNERKSDVSIARPPASNANGSPALGGLVDSKRGHAPPPPPPSSASIADLKRSSAAPPPPPSLRSAAPPPPSLRSAAPPPPPSARNAAPPAPSAPVSAPPPPSARSAAVAPPPPSARSAPPLPPPPSARGAVPLPPPPSARSAAPLPPAPSADSTTSPVASDRPVEPSSAVQAGPAVKPPAPVTLEEPTQSVMVADGVEAMPIEKAPDRTQADTDRAIPVAPVASSLDALAPIEPVDDADDEFDNTPTQLLAPAAPQAPLSARLPAGLASSRSASVPPPPPTLPALPRPAALPASRLSAPPRSASIPPAIVSSEPPPSMQFAPPPQRSRWAMPVLAAAAAALLVTSGLLVAKPKALGFGGNSGSIVVSVAGPGGTVVPSVKIMVDGSTRCESAPCRVQGLSAAAHFVQVSAPGYETTAARAVTVTDGNESVVPVQLVKDKQGDDSTEKVVQADTGSTAPDQQKKKEADVPTLEVSDVGRPAERAPAPAHGGPIGSTKEKPAAPSGAGRLNINSIPISNVVLDGRPIGSTPQVGISVPAGSHTVVFIGPDGKRQVRGASVKAGGTSSVAVRF